MKLKRVVAIIILYNPNLSVLNRSINSLKTQVSKIVLVDNTSFNKKVEEFVATLKDERIEYIPLGYNAGVAKAQNIGIEFAIGDNAEYVLIMDQDSITSENMVSLLRDDLVILRENGVEVGVIGPTPINKQTQKAYEPRLRKKRFFLDKDTSIVKVNELISSGSLIHSQVFAKVGLMDENLFIDGVDHEWCWRAKSLGYFSAMSTKATLEHMLGEGDRKIFGISIAITTPVRLYYQYRNYFYLTKKDYVPLYWKMNNFIKYCIKMIYYPLVVRPRLAYLNNIYRGIKEGIFYNP